MATTRVKGKSTRFHQPALATSLHDTDSPSTYIDEAEQQIIHEARLYTDSPSTYIDEAEQQIIHEARQQASIELYAEMTAPSPSTSVETQSQSSSGPVSASTLASSNDASPSTQSSPGDAPPNCLVMGKYSDLIIVHKERSWQAHKIIVSSKSPVLGAAIEALKEPILDLSRYEPNAVTYLIGYIYCSNYPTPDTTPSYSLPLHLNIFIVASDLQMPDLQSLAVEKFQHDLINLVTDAKIYFEIVRQVYKYTTLENPELRLVVVDMAMAEMQTMLADENVRWGFLRLTSDVTEFQTDIYEGLMGRAVRYAPAPHVLCEECGPMEESERGFVVVNCERCKMDRRVMIG